MGAAGPQEMETRGLSSTLRRPCSPIHALERQARTGGGGRGAGRGHASEVRSPRTAGPEQEPKCCVCTKSGRAGG